MAQRQVALIRRSQCAVALVADISFAPTPQSSRIGPQLTAPARFNHGRAADEG